MREFSADFFVLRSTLLPFDAWQALSKEPGVRGGDVECWDWEAGIPRHVLLGSLSTLLARPEVREAMWLSSPESLPLADAVVGGSEEPDERAVATLVRYLSRLVGRATPFGLFGAVSLGHIGKQTCLDIGGTAALKRRSRLDMGYVSDLVTAVEADQESRPALMLMRNPTLWEVCGRFHYVQRVREGDRWRCHLTATDATPYLQSALALASNGVTHAALVSALAVSEAVPTREAEAFVEDLLDAEILLSACWPPVNGGDPVDEVINRLPAVAGQTLKVELTRVKEGLSEIDAAGVGVPPARYVELRERLPQGEARAVAKHPFQVDLYRDAPSLSLKEEIVEEVLRGVEVLRTFQQPGDSDPLRRFRERFVERYGTRRVPLLEALDGELGVGLSELATEGSSESLLEGIRFDRGDGGRAWETERRHRWILARLEEAWRSGSREIVAEPLVDELGGVKPEPAYPDAFGVLAVLGARSAEAADRGDFRILLRGASGPSGANLVGRFCHLDARLRRAVEDHLRAEETLRPDAVFAEVAHLPAGRLGNVALRPLMRSHEILCFGTTRAGESEQIALSDLMVSVRNDRVVLYSAKLSREVLPRLTTAHNFLDAGSNLSVYRFLGLLQADGRAGRLSWQWGPFAEASFLPRVRVGRVVLARATWRVSREELGGLRKASGRKRLTEVEAWRQKRGVPRWAALVDDQAEMLLDFANALSVEMLLQHSSKSGSIRIEEMFPSPDELPVTGEGGHFVHELVIPVVRKREAAKPKARPRQLPSGVIDPPVIRYPPGSEWIFANAYAGASILDQVLLDAVAPLVSNAIVGGIADRWYFVRFADPEWHLRLRFHGEARRLKEDLLPQVLEMLKAETKSERCWRVGLGTYEPEVERYGGTEGLAVAETIFHHDSEACLELLALAKEAGRGDTRWRIGICSIDHLLRDIHLDLGERRELMRRLRRSFGEEQGVGAPARRGIGERFRQEREALESLLTGECSEDSLMKKAKAILCERSRRNADAQRRLQAATREGKLRVPLDEFASSIVHMNVNRLLRTAHRQQEAVLYDLLARLYDSQLARGEDHERTRGVG